MQGLIGILEGFTENNDGNTCDTVSTGPDFKISRHTHLCFFLFLKIFFFMITNFDCEHRSSTHLCIQSFCLKRAANQSDFIYLLISANKKVCLVS